MFVEGAGVRRSTPLATVQIDDAWKRNPRIIRFSDGAWCEVTDAQALAAMLGADPSAAAAVRNTQWERVPRALIAVLVVMLVAVAALYHFGVPIVARVVANQVPISATAELSRSVIESLDGGTFKPTTLSAARRQQLTGLFHQVVGRSSSTPYTLLFRSSPTIGPNAMALPSGTIVITDELVALARDDRELIGVLAHEAGHVVHQHGLRNMLQNSIVGLGVAWFIGDVSTIAAAAPTALLEAKYSRELETEADLYAIDVLHANGIPIRHLANLLRRLDTEAGHSNVPGVLEYLSSHPATAERLQRLEGR